MDMIKVSANSRTSAVAGAIAGVVSEHKRAEVQAIGAGAEGADLEQRANRSDAAEQTVFFVARTRRKVEQVRIATLPAVAKLKCPQSRDAEGFALSVLERCSTTPPW